MDERPSERSDLTLMSWAALILGCLLVLCATCHSLHAAEPEPPTIVPLAVVVQTDGWEVTITTLMQRCKAIDARGEIVAKHGLMTIGHVVYSTLLLGCQIPPKPNT